MLTQVLPLSAASDGQPGSTDATAPKTSGLGSKELDFYIVGNSLIRQLSLGRLGWLFQQAGGTLGYGHQGAADCPLENQFTLMRNGKPLRTGNEETRPYGNYPDALSKAQFDAVILQVYNQWLENVPANPEGAPGAAETVGKFIDFARGKNPANHKASETFYIMGGWPEILGIHYRNPSTKACYEEGAGFGDSFTGFTFADFYNSPYTLDVMWGQPRNGVALKDFYGKLLAQLNEKYKDLPSPIRLIPGGEVLAALDKKIREGTLPGIEAYFTRPANAEYYANARSGEKIFPIPPGVPFDARYGVVNFYTDRFHFTNQPHNSAKDGAIGGYVTSLTVYSTLTGQSPVGLPATINGKGWEQFDPIADADLIRALQETVWDVVSNHPLTDVKP
jgi:hypothetical protein